MKYTQLTIITVIIVSVGFKIKVEDTSIKSIRQNIDKQTMDSIIDMEKFIFDPRRNLTDSPKFLKRNNQVLPTHKPPPKQDNYLDNKIFVTFNYSYYQHLFPKHNSLHFGKRMHNLHSLIPLSQKGKSKMLINQADFEQSKWKEEKNMRVPSGERCESKAKPREKKIKSPQASHPSVGYYSFDSTAVQKKIVYDVKVRGKPRERAKKLSGKENSPQTKDEGPTLQRNQKTGSIRPATYHNDKRWRRNMNREQEEYCKFLKEIDVGTVWKKLMEKHRLKGSKFDFHSHVE